MESTLKTNSLIWGPLTGQYALDSPRQNLSIKKPTPSEISEAIGLVKSGYPSCATFELLLSLPHRKKYLRNFLDRGLFPGCMRLLKEYCETNSMCGTLFCMFVIN